MGLVDLRGRENDPAVRLLLTFAHGSPQAVDDAVSRYRDREWLLVGWEDSARGLAACAGVERVSDRELGVRSLAVAPGLRGRGIGRAFVDALAVVATARRLVAETDEDAVGFYSRCGFSVEEIEPKGGRARYRCSRTIEAIPGAANAVRSLTLSELESVIRESWGRDTSDDPDEWSESNPARGQCAVTALLVRDLVGGEILLANVLRDGERVERHAWNRLSSGLSLDLTRSQFQNGEEFEEPTPGEPMVADRSRYELLAVRVRERLEGR
jgi:GNAT superfamily N-acetyltransferase